MYHIWKTKNRILILVISLLLIALMGLADLMTGIELSSALFYLAPITLFALYHDSKVFPIIICSVFASMVWFFAEYYPGDYSNLFFPVWNAFVKCTIFSAVGLLVYYLKEKEKKLSAANEFLRDTNEEKNIFIGIAAHDLRNPISGIYSLSDLLLVNNKDNANQEITEDLEYIKTLSSNALTILKDLLNVSRLESGKVELNIKSEDYIAFIKQQIKLNQLIAKQKKISIQFMPQSESILADFDINYMKEVIDNLLSNAIKYSEPDSKIFVIVTLQKDGTILTEVIDTGKGIDEGEQKNLFQYFQTTSTRPTNGEQSTGLGLAIAKQIIDLHDGEIGVKSVINQGSTFFYSFPLHKKEV